MMSHHKRQKRELRLFLPETDCRYYNLMQSFLTNRHQRVLNGQSSTWSLDEAGISHGSILDPLLFLVYINDLLQNFLLMTLHCSQQSSPVMSASKLNENLPKTTPFKTTTFFCQKKKDISYPSFYFNKAWILACMNNKSSFRSKAVIFGIC